MGTRRCSTTPISCWLWMKPTCRKRSDPLRHIFDATYMLLYWLTRKHRRTRQWMARNAQCKGMHDAVQVCTPDAVLGGGGDHGSPVFQWPAQASGTPLKAWCCMWSD